MYKKIYEVGNKRQTGKENTHLIHLWTDEGYEKLNGKTMPIENVVKMKLNSKA
jgi:hypothetical protein